ncbi:MAG: hypothetical protein KZQ96_20975 [Candidatus Thiodiazotropha sp. (ex Lucinoma borealis)]|nr:hypothetical protein [Candidatus Thiodiazotropha sp. (ex Lucinoma borealis)]
MAITIRNTTFTNSRMIVMTLQSFKDRVKGPALAAGLGAAMFGAFSTAAQAEGAQCAPLEQAASGHVFDASTSAYIYSQENIGAVGISIFPGVDLGRFTGHDLGTKLVKIMEMNGVEAECFVHNEPGPNGTAVNFKIAGLSWKEDGSLNASQSFDKETLRGVIAEAKTAKELLAARSQPLAALD